MAMEISVLEQEDNRIKFALEGAGHTFCNNLKHELYSDKAVKSAAYKVDHPLVSTPTFIVQTTKKANFSKIFKEVAKNIKDENGELLKAVNKL